MIQLVLHFTGLNYYNFKSYEFKIIIFQKRVDIIHPINT